MSEKVWRTKDVFGLQSQRLQCLTGSIALGLRQRVMAKRMGQSRDAPGGSQQAGSQQEEERASAPPQVLIPREHLLQSGPTFHRFHNIPVILIMTPSVESEFS